MTNHQNGPPDEVGPRDTTPEGTDTESSATTTDNRKDNAPSRHWCGATAMRRRRQASWRCVPLDCGCPDLWPCRCTEPPLSDRALDGWRDAAVHVLSIGQVPLLPLEVRRSLWRRGGTDRVLAEQLHAATGGRAA
jgi:hypothetical protein